MLKLELALDREALATSQTETAHVVARIIPEAVVGSGPRPALSVVFAVSRETGLNFYFFAECSIYTIFKPCRDFCTERLSVIGEERTVRERSAMEGSKSFDKQNGSSTRSTHYSMTSTMTEYLWQDPFDSFDSNRLARGSPHTSNFRNPHHGEISGS